MSLELDRYDHAILRALKINGRIPITELADKIGLSRSPTQARIKAMEQAGVIKGYRAIVDPVRVGLPHVAFIEVRLSNTRESALSAFNKAVREVPEIEECHLIAASFDYLLKIRTADMPSYRRVLAEVVSALPHVSNTSTFVVMEAIRETE